MQEVEALLCQCDRLTEHVIAEDGVDIVSLGKQTFDRGAVLGQDLSGDSFVGRVAVTS